MIYLKFCVFHTQQILSSTFCFMFSVIISHMFVIDTYRDLPRYIDILCLVSSNEKVPVSVTPQSLLNFDFFSLPLFCDC